MIVHEKNSAQKLLYIVVNYTLMAMTTRKKCKIHITFTYHFRHSYLVKICATFNVRKLLDDFRAVFFAQQILRLQKFLNS